jgi:hypothetical protein
VGLIGAVDATSYKYKVLGNFSFLAGPDGKCATGDDVGGVISDLAPAAFATDCSSFTVTYPVAAFPPPAVNAPDAVVNDFIYIAFDSTKVGKLSPQVFPSTYTFGYGTDKTSVFNFGAGEWTINGALVFVPYMPYADNISQILYIANRGSQLGDISVDAFDEAGNSYSFDVGTVAGSTVRKLTQEIADGLATAGFTAPGKVAFEITVTAPADDIDVYSAYNVGGSDRGTVVNSQNGRAKECGSNCFD